MGNFILKPNQSMVPSFPLGKYYTKAQTDALLASAKNGSVGTSIGGAGSVITTGVQGVVRVPYSGTITGYYLTSTVSGSCVIDVWKTNFAGYPATVANTITGSDIPTLSSATKSSSTALTGWTTAVTAGDYIFFNVNSASTVTSVQLQLTITKS